MCLLLHFIYANTKFFIRSGIHLVESFESSIGLPQGCCLSPILFCLFVADLPQCLPHAGVPLGAIFLKYLQFADDLALVANSASELQAAIDALATYCVENCLNINVDKTKVLVFHRGRLQQHAFYLGEKEIEQVSSFTYLGFTFTPQLSFTKHVENLNQKASSKCGLLLSKLNNINLPLHIILELFNCYILPTYKYGLTLWLGRTSDSVMDSVNSIFTKFLKCYLGVPYRANNSITHFITHSQPLSIILQNIYHQSFSSLNFPACLNGLQISQSINVPDQYDPLPLIPSYFWRSKYPGFLPLYSRSRSLLCHEIFDFNHTHYCTIPSFHATPADNCTCVDCGEMATTYHQYFCSEKL